MADLFDEVEEQLRSDRYRTLAMKALPWVLAVLAAVLIGFLAFWGWRTYTERASSKASEQYAAAVEAMSEGRAPQAEQLWTEVSKSSARAYKSLALMNLGGLKLRENQPAEAVKLFDEAAKVAPDEVIGDAARLKSALALLDTAPYKDVEARLTPLMKDGHPYRVQAREALAFAKLTAGNLGGARGDFVVISNLLDAPQSAQQRAKAAIELIDSGSAKAIPSAAKAAATLPPMPAMMPPGLSAGPPPPQAPGPQ